MNVPYLQVRLQQQLHLLVVFQHLHAKGLHVVLRVLVHPREVHHRQVGVIFEHLDEKRMNRANP